MTCSGSNPAAARRFSTRALKASRLILAGTVGAIPYLARPIDMLRCLGRGTHGALACAWDNDVRHRPAGYNWLRATRRE
jgi:hypothetical protein